MVDAMQSSGGVPGLCVRLCDRVVSSPVLQIKLDEVSTIANVEYSDTFIRVWKAYGMGKGKKITFSKLNLPADLQTASLSTLKVFSRGNFRQILSSQVKKNGE